VVLIAWQYTIKHIDIELELYINPQLQLRVHLIQTKKYSFSYFLAKLLLTFLNITF